ELVEEQLAEEVHAAVIAAVVQPRSVLGPCDRGPLHALQLLLAVLAGRNVAHLPLLPIRAGLLDAVSDALAILAGDPRSQCRRAIGQQRGGIEQHTWR